ncbi:LysR family transcriptional regulator [Microvirga zambiensis]|uniref:LysR family transcriptional regulator n=1 Tax=Microvirga zambiensis TaxID=1402137 RepID=UPI00191FFE28|nr:LysR family transcriptional regulator [Microvirga zambiensis]
MHPTLRHLQIFRLFSRVLNVTETARLLRISQPTVSQALKELEAQLGVSLIVRGSGPMKLTSDAEILLNSIDQVLDSMQTLRDGAAKLRGEHNASISVASIFPLTPTILPRAITRLQEAEGDFRVHLEAQHSREVARLVKERTVEVGFTLLPVEHQDLTVRPLMSTEMICLIPPSHRLADRDVITPDDLKDERVITLGEQIRQEFDARLFLYNGLNDTRIITTNNASVSLSMVRHSMGIAVTLPYILTQGGFSDIAVARFQPDIRRRLVAIYLKQPAMSPLSKKLIALVIEELRSFNSYLNSHGIQVGGS